MPRKVFDCREWPGPCTVSISGEESEVLEAQLKHVIQVHRLQDSPELREQIRASLKDAPVGV